MIDASVLLDDPRIDVEPLSLERSPKKIINAVQMNLPYIRVIAGWSQKDLAEMLFISRVEVAHIESGRRKLNEERCKEILYRYEEKMNNDSDNKDVMEHTISTLVYDNTNWYTDELANKLRTVMEHHRSKLGSNKGMNKIRESMLYEIREYFKEAPLDVYKVKKLKE